MTIIGGKQEASVRGVTIVTWWLGRDVNVSDEMNKMK